MKTLIIYGEQPGWKIHTNELFHYLSTKIDSIKQITNVLDLKKYLYNNQCDKNYIIPLTESHFTELLNSHITAIMPRDFIVKEFTNKQLFANYVLKNKLNQYFPKIYLNNDNSNTNVVVKPPFGGNSVGVYLANINNIRAEVFKKNVVQEYITADTEYTGNFVVDNGKIIFCFAYSRYYGNRKYIKHDEQDNTVQNRVEIKPKHIAQFEKFLMPVKYTGPCNIDYKIINDDIVVFEINSRLGGSLTFLNHVEDFSKMILFLINLKI